MPGANTLASVASAADSFPIVTVTRLEGMVVERPTAGAYRVRRETREARVEVDLDLREWREPHLATTLAFFDHMLELLCWYAGIALAARFETKTFRLTHVVCEDVGLAVGLAVREAVRDRIPDGVESVGEAHGIMDEALAFAMISHEGRARSRIERGGAAASERVEDMLGADLVAFFEGFAQGARATVRVRVLEADDPHHAWEAAFRAFGRALRCSLAPNPRRAGLTAGVKGTLD
jgi:imidazoleglycerol-phosphate dehydratase